MDSVLVVIINYKTSNLIQGLLDSIKENGVALSIVILDNASTKETFQTLLQIKDERVRLLKSEKNLGFTGGINYVLKSMEGTKENFRYFFLLNPDAFSKPELISNLTAILAANPKAACISPKILNLKGQPWYQGGKIHFSKGQVIMEQNPAIKKTQLFVETDVFNGCAALFDLGKVKEAGLFNEALFMYYDEADLSIRLKKLGYKILFAPQFEILHDVSYTTRKISHLKTYYMTRNRFMVFSSTMSAGNKLYFLAHELAFHFKNRRLKNAVYHLKGYLDFTFGKSGALESR